MQFNAEQMEYLQAVNDIKFSVIDYLDAWVSKLEDSKNVEQMTVIRPKKQGAIPLSFDLHFKLNNVHFAFNVDPCCQCTLEDSKRLSHFANRNDVYCLTIYNKFSPKIIGKISDSSVNIKSKGFLSLTDESVAKDQEAQLLHFELWYYLDTANAWQTKLVSIRDLETHKDGIITVGDVVISL